MERIERSPRKNWQKKMTDAGFYYPVTDRKVYWDESTCYRFTKAQIDELELAGNKVYEMYCQSTGWLIENNMLHLLHIPEAFHELIKQSWLEDHTSLIGRFDFVYDGIRPPKLYEFNADTPSGLLEAAIIQWQWLEETYPEKDQFNLIYEVLLESWQDIFQKYPCPYHFACANDLEDITNTEFMKQIAFTAYQEWVQYKFSTEGKTHEKEMAGFIENKFRFLLIDQINWFQPEDNTTGFFLDSQDHPIHFLYNLYPWEWFLEEALEANILASLQNSSTKFIEPAWKFPMSSKAMLPIIFQDFPGSEYLLPAFFEYDKKGIASLFGSYAKKPFFSREGANVSLFEYNTEIAATGGEYGQEGYIYQELCKPPQYYDSRTGTYNNLIIGLWIIGGTCCGMNLREDPEYIINNNSTFVPHFFEPA